MRSAVRSMWVAYMVLGVVRAEIYSTSSYDLGQFTSTSTVSTILTVTIYSGQSTAVEASAGADGTGTSVQMSASEAMPPSTLGPSPSTGSNPSTSTISMPPTAGTLAPSTISSSSSLIFGTTTLSISGLSDASQTTTTLAGQTTPTILPVFPCPPCKMPSNAIIVFPIGPDFPIPGTDIPPPPGLVPIHIGPNGSATPEPDLPLPTPVIPTPPSSQPPDTNPASPDPDTPSPPDNSPTSQQTASTKTSSSELTSSSTSTSSSSSSSTGSTITATGDDNWPAMNTAAAASLGQLFLAEQSAFYACSTPVGLFSFTGSCSSSAGSSSTSSTSLAGTNVPATFSTLTTTTLSTTLSSSPPSTPSLATTFSCVQPRPTDAPSPSTLISSLLQSDNPFSDTSTSSAWISQMCSLPSSQFFSPTLEDRSLFLVGNASFYIMQITRSSATVDLQSCTTGLSAVLDCVANQGFYGGLWETANEYYNITNPEAPGSPF